MADKGYTWTRTIAATPKQVFAVLCDLKNVKEWQPSIQNVREVDDKPVGLGKAWVETRRLKDGKTAVTTVRVTKFDEGKELGINVSHGPARMDFTFRLEPDGSGTKVTYTGEGRMAGLLFFLGGGLRKQMAKEDEGLLEALETRVLAVTGKVGAGGTGKTGKATKAVVTITEKTTTTTTTKGGKTETVTVRSRKSR